MTDANIVAEPSAATFNGNDQNTWSPEQREHWNQTGKTPEPPKKQEAAPASPTEKKSESEPSGKSAADTETAEKQEKARKPGEKLSAEERIAQLNARIKQLEETTSKKPEPAKTDAKPVEPPKRPNPYTFKGTPEEFEKAMDDYETAKEESQERRFAEKQLTNARNQQFVAKVEEARARYGQEKFDETIELASKSIAAQAAPTVKEYLQQSDMFADLLYVIGGDQKSLDDFIASAKSNPIAAIRKLAFLEIEIGKELSKGKEEKKEEAEPEKKAEAPAKPEPRAPKPPSEVGGRGTAPTDEAAEAARSGDFKRASAEWDREMRARYAKA